MAIKSVTNANLAEYVAERAEIKSPDLQTAEQITELVNRRAEGNNPVVEAKETTPSISDAVDPGKQEPTAAKQKKNNPVQPRIDELTREKRELEEFAESEYEMRLRAERRIGELETELKTAKPAPVVEERKEAVEPDPTKYTDQKEFLKDWGAWNRAQALKEFNAEQGRIAAQKAAEEQNARLAAQIEQAKADLPDFVEVIEGARREEEKAPFVPEHVKAAILDSEVGAYLAYHLRKHPDDEKRIYALTPAKALLELGKLELKYTKDGKASAKTSTTPLLETSKAPPPPPKLSGNAQGVVSSDMSKPMSFKDYRSQRLEQMRQRGRR
jgi:hypothetical protein